MASSIPSSISKTAFEVEEKIFARKSAGRPSFFIPFGDPINDPKPNLK
jgi:hypothetical protein